jgi:glutaminase
MQLQGNKTSRYEGFRQVMSGFCNREVRLDAGMYLSESSTAARNRAIADKLLEHKICESEYDKEHGLDAYFMMCSTLLNTVDLAVLAATCAYHGQNPISKKNVVDQSTNAEMINVMMTCGMYNGAGNWMVDVGIPAKSGVSGAIFGVVPNVCGVAVFSPALNSNYNSVRGIKACTELCQRLGLHVLHQKKAKLSLKEVITGTRKPVTHQDVLDKETAKYRANSRKGSNAFSDEIHTISCE